MKEDKWAKDDNARISLMKDVYNNRMQTVDYKGKAKEVTNWAKDLEKREVAALIAQQEKEDWEKRNKKQMTLAEHQGNILKQVNEIDRTKRRDLQEKMYEERAAKLAEMDYVRKIDTDKRTNTDLLNNWRMMQNQ